MELALLFPITAGAIVAAVIVVAVMTFRLRR